MKISMTFFNEETTIELIGENDAEFQLLGIINEHESLKIKSHKHEDQYTGWNRPYFKSPTSLTLHLKKHEEPAGDLPEKAIQ
jgi:hypothetical protein